MGINTRVTKNEIHTLKSREDYIRAIKPGCIIAYKNNDGMFTGKVIAVFDDHVNIRTLNNSIYSVDKNDITWVKTGSHWPLGIYNALETSKKKG